VSQLNNAVWDVEHGSVLKLVDGKEVSDAMHGFNKLSRPQICAMYGDPPVFSQLKWPDQTKQLE
jgi:hypothetical protein